LSENENLIFNIEATILWYFEEFFNGKSSPYLSNLHIINNFCCTESILFSKKYSTKTEIINKMKKSLQEKYLSIEDLISK